MPLRTTFLTQLFMGLLLFFVAMLTLGQAATTNVNVFTQNTNTNGTTSIGNTAADAQNFIQTILDEVYKELPTKQNNISKYAYLENFTTQVFAFPYMSAWSLGNYFKLLNFSDKELYLNTAKQYMVLYYGDVFDRTYTLYTFKIDSSLKQGDDYLVRLTAKTKRRASAKQENEVLDIVWKLRYSNSEQKFYIVDVILNNISFINVQRSDFQSLYNANKQDIHLFLQKLQAKVNSKRQDLGLALN